MNFTEREQLVLNGLMCGMTDQQIADRLELHVNSVRVHTKAIMRKLGLHNRTQAAVWGLKQRMAANEGD